MGFLDQFLHPPAPATPEPNFLEQFLPQSVVATRQLEAQARDQLRQDVTRAGARSVAMNLASGLFGPFSGLARGAMGGLTGRGLEQDFEDVSRFNNALVFEPSLQAMNDLGGNRAAQIEAPSAQQLINRIGTGPTISQRVDQLRQQGAMAPIAGNELKDALAWSAAAPLGPLASQALKAATPDFSEEQLWTGTKHAAETVFDLSGLLDLGGTAVERTAAGIAARRLPGLLGRLTPELAMEAIRGAVEAGELAPEAAQALRQQVVERQLALPTERAATETAGQAAGGRYTGQPEIPAGWTTPEARRENFLSQFLEQPQQAAVAAGAPSVADELDLAQFVQRHGLGPNPPTAGADLVGMAREAASEGAYPATRLARQVEAAGATTPAEAFQDLQGGGSDFLRQFLDTADGSRLRTAEELRQQRRDGLRVTFPDDPGVAEAVATQSGRRPLEVQADNAARLAQEVDQAARLRNLEQLAGQTQESPGLYVPPARRLKSRQVFDEPAAPPESFARQYDQLMKSDHVGVNPDEVNVDPKTFQFKQGGDSQGVIDTLRDQKAWEPQSSGVSVVYEDLDGRLWIVDGHQRLGLAKRLKASGEPVDKLESIVLREADGVTRSDARALASLKNLREGTGTPVDAAKLFRELGPDDPRIASLPRAKSAVSQGRDLARLGDESFLMVVNEQVPSAYGAAVGKHLDDPAEQLGAMRALARIQPETAYKAEQIVKDIKAQGLATRTEQGGLFGDEIWKEDLLAERADIFDQAMRLAKSDKRIFNAIVENRGRIERAGNQLDTGANQAELGAAQRLEAGLEEAKYVGPVNSALTRAAYDLKQGNITKADAARAFLRAVEEHSLTTTTEKTLAQQAGHLEGGSVPVIEGQSGLAFSRPGGGAAHWQTQLRRDIDTASQLAQDGRAGMGGPDTAPSTQTAPGSVLPSRPLATDQLPSYRPEQIKSKGDLARDLRDAVGMRLLYGRRQGMLGAGAGQSAGWFNRFTNQAATALPNDLPVIYHELAGHALDKRFGMTETFRHGPPGREMEWYGDPTRPGSMSSFEPGHPHRGTAEYRRGEGFAEFVRDWFENPEAAKQQAPNLHQVWDQLLDKERVLGNQLRKARADYWARENAPAAARIRAHIKDEDPTKLANGKGVMNWLKTDFVQDVVDRYAPFERAVKHVAEATGKELLTPDRDVYLQMRALAGNDNIHNAFLSSKPLRYNKEALTEAPMARLLKNAGIDDDIIRSIEEADPQTGAFLRRLANDTEAPKSLQQILEPLGDNTEKFLNFRDYLVAARTLELEKRGLRTGIDVADARRVFDQFDPHFREMANDVYKWQDSGLLYAVEGGYLTPQQALKMRQANQSYVPFQRVFEVEAGVAPARAGHGGARGVVAGQPGSLRKIQGSVRELLDPFEVMVKNNAELIEATERNRVGQVMARLYDDMGAINETAVQGGRRYTVSLGINEEKQPLEAWKVDFGASLTQREMKAALEEAGIQVNPLTRDQMVDRLASMEEGKLRDILTRAGLPVKKADGAALERRVRSLGQGKLKSILEANNIPTDGMSRDQMRDLLEALPEKNLFRKARNLPANVVRVKMPNGSERFFSLDHDMYRSWTAMDEGSLHLMARVLEPVANALRTGATRWNPAFIARNIARDTVQAAVVSRVGSLPVINSLEGAYHLMVHPIISGLPKVTRERVAEEGIRAVLKDLTHSPLMDEFKRFRGAQGADEAVSKSVRQKAYSKIFRGMTPTARRLTWLPPDLAQAARRAGWAVQDAITSPIRLLEHLSDVSDQVTRLGEMAQAKRVLRQRFPDWSDAQIAERAAFEARDLMDFSQRGGDEAIRNMRRVIPFSGSSISGNYRWVKAFRENPRGTLAKGLGYIGLPALGLYLLNRPNPHYWMLDQRERDTMFHVPVPQSMWARFDINDPIEAFIRIPKPHLLGTLFATIPQRWIEWMDAEQPESFGKLAGQLVNAFIQGASPVGNLFDLGGPGLKTAFELVANRDTFRNRDIETSFDEKKKPWDRYDEYTSLTARKLAQAIGSDQAEVLRNLPIVGNALGMVESPKRIDHVVGNITGGAGVSFLQSFIDPAVARFTGEDTPKKRRKNLSGFQTTSNYSEAERRWFERYRELEQAHNSDVLKPDQRSEWARMRNAEKKLKDLRKKVRSERDPARIDALKMQIRDIIDRAMPVPMPAATRDRYARG